MDQICKMRKLSFMQEIFIKKKDMVKEVCNFTSALVELIMSNIGWPKGTISGKNIHGRFWLIVNISSNGISMITCTVKNNWITWWDGVSRWKSTNKGYQRLQNDDTRKTTKKCWIARRITDPSSTKRFNILGSKYTETIRALPKFNSICSNSSNISNFIKIRICWL